ncbi:MAG: helix-turn-helix domain-containing protein [Planctomycetota bacterium]
MKHLAAEQISPKRITEIRCALGASDAELAGLLGVRAGTLRAYEEGRAAPPERAARILARILASHNRGAGRCAAGCWEVRRCSAADRADCASYRLNGGEVCWLLTDGLCAAGKPEQAGIEAGACHACALFKMLDDADYRPPRGRRSAAGRAPAAATGEPDPEGCVLCGMPRPERAPSGR